MLSILSIFPSGLFGKLYPPVVVSAFKWYFPTSVIRTVVEFSVVTTLFRVATWFCLVYVKLCDLFPSAFKVYPVFNPSLSIVAKFALNASLVGSPAFDPCSEMS